MRRVLVALTLAAALLPFSPAVQAQQQISALVFGGPFGLWSIGADGKNEQFLNSGAGADMPSVSPDGKRVVYTITGTPETGAWILDLETNTRQQIALEPWRWPAWSPDGRGIAFTLSTFQGSDIFVYDMATRQARPVVVGNGFNEAPNWWRDGSRIVYSKNGELWNLNINTGDSGPLRGTIGQVVLQAAWSPDGQRLAYMTVAADRSFTDPDAATRLFVATSEGSDGQWIAEGRFDRTQRLAWSPDNTRIAFASLAGFGTDISVIFSTGGSITRISDGRNPSWRPAATTAPAPISATCDRAPERMYASAFEKNPGSKARIGCPVSDIATVDGVMQTFERGFMYFRSVPSGTSVWVFYNDGTWAAGDPRPGALPPSSAPPPPGRFVPRNAFLQVWLAQGGPNSRIGFAIDEETGFASDSQNFERGIGLAGNNRVVFLNVDGSYHVVMVP